VLGHGKRDAVSLGYSRIAAGAVAGIAAAAVTLASVPALADQVRHQEWWLTALHVPTAWQSSRGGSMTIAVLDTGVDPAQADLGGAVITGPDYTHSGRTPGSPEWGVHGTAMASLIAGRGHGPGHNKGIIGVAPAAQILSVRVTLEAGDQMLADRNVAKGLPGAIAKGIRYAVDHGAAVIDLPLDPVTAPGAPGAGGPAEKAAVAYALRHDVVLVAPAGDGGTSTDPVTYPAAYPGVIAVGAFDRSFTKPAFSSHRKYVTITAPGVGMTAAALPSGYTHVSSTSAASAVVSGIVALVRAQFPDLSPAQVTKVLTQSTVYRPAGGRVAGSGAGTVDAGLALLAAARLDKAGPPPSPPASPAVTTHGKAPAASAAAGTGSRSSLLMPGIVAVALALIVLVLLGLAIIGARRRRARAARLAPIRLAAQMQPRRAALPAGGAPPPGGAAALSDRVAASTAVAFAGRPDGKGSGRGEAPWGASPWPAAPVGGPADASGPAGSGISALSGTAAAGPAAGAGGATPGSALVPVNPGGRALPQRQGSASADRSSGTPPWEPAPKPETELPWTATPASRVGGAAIPAALPQRRALPPEKAPWDAIAEEAWPGGPAAGRPQPTRPGAAGPGPSGGDTTTGGAADGGFGAGGTPGAAAAGTGAGAWGAGAGGFGSPVPASSANGATGGYGGDGTWNGAAGNGMLGAGVPDPPYGLAAPGSMSPGGTPSEAASRPLYGWSLGEATESFPAVGPDND
jgi:hypothetical protein